MCQFHLFTLKQKQTHTSININAPGIKINKTHKYFINDNLHLCNGRDMFKKKRTFLHLGAISLESCSQVSTREKNSFKSFLKKKILGIE